MDQVGQVGQVDQVDQVGQVDPTNEYLKLHLDDDIESSMEETPLDSWVSNRL